MTSQILKDLQEELDSLLEQIRVKLYASGITTTEVAHAIGANPVTVRLWMVGINCPSPKYLVKFAKILNMDPEELAKHYNRIKNVRRKIREVSRKLQSPPPTHPGNGRDTSA